MPDAQAFPNRVQHCALPRAVRTIFVCALLALSACASLKPRGADLVLRGGVVRLMDSGRSAAQSLAVRDGRIVFVGSDAQASGWIGPGTRVVDLAGKAVLPGFHDAHVHPLTGGIELGECNLNEAKDAKEILETVRSCAASEPRVGWVRGGGWQLPAFSDEGPDKALLDEMIPDRPVYLTGADGHSAWVNSKALEVAGIVRGTPDPEGGRIERRPDGSPRGTLREAAMNLVAKHLPAYTLDDRVRGLERGLERARRFGITTVQEADANEENLKAYMKLDRAGRLTARVLAAARADPERGVEQVADLVRLRRTYRGKGFRVNAVKLFLDGVIEARTAAVLEPYLDKGERGKANWEPGPLNALVSALDAEGFQVHVHAIGDRAIRMALDAFEEARRRHGVRDWRHHMAHIQLIDPADISRFRKLGVVANFQPLWMCPDEYITKLTIPALGPKRSRWLYPIASVAKTGAMVAAGSDWSVSSMNPLEAMQVAVTREELGKGKGSPWIPEELVALDTIVSAYTSGGALALFQEKETGTLELGKAADLVVLDRDIFSLPVGEISTAKVFLTFLEGREVYRAAE